MFNEFVNILVKLGPALAPFAWPTVALIAMPFVIKRLGIFANTVTGLQNIVNNKKGVSGLLANVEKLSDETEKVITAQERLQITLSAVQSQSVVSLMEYTEKLRAVQEDLRNTLVSIQIDRIEKASVKEQAEAISGLSIEENQGDRPAIFSGPQLTPAEMKDKVGYYWKELQDLLRDKFDEANIEPDFRSPRVIGMGVARLSEQDGRKKQQLVLNDAELAATLGTFIKSITKNQTGLTQETYEQFRDGAEFLSKKIRGWKPKPPAADLPAVVGSEFGS